MQDPLINAAEAAASPLKPLYSLTRWRWFVLLFFSISNMNQCLAWFSFSSANEATMQSFFGARASRSTLNMLLNWGPIMGVLCFPLQSWIMQQRGGLRRAIWCGLLLGLTGNLIRCIPIFYTASTANSNFVRSATAFFLYHFGQILIAAAGPFQMAATTRLAVVWFAETERTTATAIATMANSAGTTIGFLNPLWLSPTPSAVPHIFYFSLALAVIPVVCACIYLPAAPRNPPSAAAATSGDVDYAATPSLVAASDASSSSSMPLPPPDNPRPGWLASMALAGSSRSFVLLVVGASVMSGIASGWQGIFQSVFGPVGLSNRAVSWMGFGNGLASIIAQVSAGVLIDKCLRRRLKLGILVGLAGACVSTLWLTLQLPAFGHLAVFGRSEATLVTAVTLAGLFQGLTAPLFYELCAELTYPVTEGMSAGLLVLLLNASSGVLILLNDYLMADSMNVIMAATFAAVLIVVMVGVREEYRRPRDA